MCKNVKRKKYKKKKSKIINNLIHYNPQMFPFSSAYYLYDNNFVHLHTTPNVFYY